MGDPKTGYVECGPVLEIKLSDIDWSINLRIPTFCGISLLKQGRIPRVDSRVFL